MDQTTEISKLRDNLLARHHLVSSTTFHKSKNKKLKNIVYHGMVQEVKNLLGSARKISFSNAFKQAMWINNNINYNPFIPYIAIKFRQKSMSFVKVIFCEDKYKNSRNLRQPEHCVQASIELKGSVSWNQNLLNLWGLWLDYESVTVPLSDQFIIAS